ncbi:hypothetical protein AD45P3_00295 [Alteromonas phage vB_AmaP_AD45-P3]|nr:hypothetical protein AD45P3_00295 [Alteromonas phage vB_AmaP_AD45-P3]
MHVFTVFVKNIVDVYGEDHLVTNQEPNVTVGVEPDIAKAALIAAKKAFKNSKNERIQEVYVSQRADWGHYIGWTNVDCTFKPEELNS